MVRTRILAPLFVTSLLMIASLCFAGTKPADKPSTIVDEGTFAVFQNGRRIATETFTIRQYPDSSITSSQFKMDGAQPGGLQQSCGLVLRPDASLSRYEWKQLAPTSGSATVDPQSAAMIV